MATQARAFIMQPLQASRLWLWPDSFYASSAKATSQPVTLSVVAASFFTSPALVVIFQPFGWLSFKHIRERFCPVEHVGLSLFLGYTWGPSQVQHLWALNLGCPGFSGSGASGTMTEPCGMDLRSLRYLPTEEMAWNGHENSMPCHRWGMTTRDAIPQASLRDATTTRVGSSKMDQDDGK